MILDPFINTLEESQNSRSDSMELSMVALQQSSPRNIYETVNEVASISDPSPPNPLTPEIQSPPVADAATTTPVPTPTPSMAATECLHLQHGVSGFEPPWWEGGDRASSGMRRHISLGSASLPPNAASTQLRRVRE